MVLSEHNLSLSLFLFFFHVPGHLSVTINYRILPLDPVGWFWLATKADRQFIAIGLLKYLTRRGGDTRDWWNKLNQFCPGTDYTHKVVLTSWYEKWTRAKREKREQTKWTEMKKLFGIVKPANNGFRYGASNISHVRHLVYARKTDTRAIWSGLSNIVDVLVFFVVVFSPLLSCPGLLLPCNPIEIVWQHVLKHNVFVAKIVFKSTDYFVGWFDSSELQKNIK